MKFKLKSDFTERIPLIIRRRNNVVYFQTQIKVAGADGQMCRIYSEKYKTEEHNIKEVGTLAFELLKKFEDIGDLSIAEFEELVGMDIKQYESIPKGEAYLKFFDARDYKDLDRNYDHCSLDYDIYRKKYSFTLWWIYKHGSRYYESNSDSLGEPKVLTFDTPLEFTDYSDPEKLGKMVIEALDRSRMIGEKIAGDPYPEKNVELASGSNLTVSPPHDKHFSDDDDYGISELYQAYLYFPREDSEEASAAFYIGMAAELDGEINEDNIRNAWEKQNGKADFFEVKAVEHGIFKFRAEMRNKKIHRISYLLEIADCDLLDCTMELRKPGSRKKLDEKLPPLFEEFAFRCKFKD